MNSFAGGVKGNRTFAAGLPIYDIKNPAVAREIAFLEMPGVGINRLWFVGGRYAYVSAHFDLRDAHEPKQIAWFLGTPPTRILAPRPGNALAPQTCAVNVQPDGTMYLSDRNAALHVLRYAG